MSAASNFRWSEVRVGSLKSLLASRQGMESILRLRGDDAVSVVNVLDQALDSPDINDRERKRYTISLRKLCGACGILPISHILTEGLEKTGDSPCASGGFADVWDGRYKNRRVAIKALRTYATDDLAKVKKRFFKEVLVWKRLSHPNVLPFLGISTSVFPFCMVSNWMSHGNIVDYVKANPKANRLTLLSDVSSGLNYLHSMDLVHGDLKGANILINGDYRACLADFGLMVLVSDPHTTYSASTTSNAGTVRWMAPELLIPEEYGFNHSKPSKPSDIYSVGMVIFEVMTGVIPFNQYGNLAVIPKIMAGVRPERPTDAEVHGLSEPVWGLVEDCWRQQRDERPLIRIVLDRLNEATRYWYPQSPETTNLESDAEHDSDGFEEIPDDLFETRPDSSVSLLQDYDMYTVPTHETSYLQDIPDADEREGMAQPSNWGATPTKSRTLLGPDYNQDATPIHDVGIKVNNESAGVSANIPQPPGLTYFQGTQSGDARFNWNLKPAKLAIGGKLDNLAVLLVRSGNNDQFYGSGDPVLRATIKTFVAMCRTLGMQVGRMEPLFAASMLPKNHIGHSNRKNAITVIRETIMKNYSKKPTVILVVLHDEDRTICDGIKHLCDVFLKVQTIFVNAARIRKGLPQYHANVALKMNMKLGGANHHLADSYGVPPMVEWLKNPREPVMLVGIDITHPGLRSVRGTPSIAAVVATIDNNFAQFLASLKIQQSNREIITELEVMMQERLDAYWKKSKVLPTRIIVYRSGISKGKTNVVGNNEVLQMKAAFNKYGNLKQPYLPKLTVVIFANNTTSTEAGSDGSRLRGGILTHNTHYYVVHDEMGFRENQLQGLTASVTHMLTREAGIAAPAYYANLACQRGRTYLYALSEFSPDGNAVTANGSESSEEQESHVYREAEKLWNGGPGDGIKDTMFYL